MLPLSTDSSGMVVSDDLVMIPLDGRGTVRMHDLHMLQLELVERGPHCYSGGKQHCGGKGAGQAAGGSDRAGDCNHGGRHYPAADRNRGGRLVDPSASVSVSQEDTTATLSTKGGRQPTSTAGF
jgi:hypothetical protein